MEAIYAIDEPMKTIQAHPAIANPFETALLEGAPATYMALASAGLHATFKPFPTSAAGFGLMANLLYPSDMSRRDGAVFERLVETLLGLEFDFLSQQSPPTSAASNYMRDLGLAHAPFASLAMAGSNSNLAIFWNHLSPPKLFSIAQTALPLACMASNDNAVSALLAAGANPNMIDSGNRPLIFRCERPSTLSLLLEAGADLRQTAIILDERRNPVETSMLAMLVDQVEKGYSRERVKEFKQLALRWAETHPEPNSMAGADVAAAAFKAIAKKNRPTIKECIKSLGEAAGSHRNESGDSLALACARRDLHLEIGLLVDRGADLFEPSTSGESAFGLLLARRPHLSSTYSKNTAADASRADKLIASALQAQPLWIRPSPSGMLPIEAMIDSAKPSDFLLFLEQAEAQGLDMRQRLSSGMDVSCALLLRGCLAQSAEHPSEKRESSTEAACNAILAKLAQSPPQASAEEAKRAFFHQLFKKFTISVANHADWRNGLPAGMLSEPPASRSSARDSLLAIGSEIAHEACELLGRSGLELIAEAYANPSSHNTFKHYLNARQWSLFFSSYERGAMDAQTSSALLEPTKARMRL